MKERYLLFTGIFMLAIGLFQTPELKANQYYGRGSCCPEYSCNPCCPLNPCSWSVQAKGGYAPGFYADLVDGWANIPAASDYLVNIPASAQMYRQMTGPWQVGGEIAYNFSCNVMVFAELNYFQGGKKDNPTSLPFPNGSEVKFTEKFQGQKGWNGYLGARYFFERCWLCNSVSPFIGVKAGFMHFNKLVCFPTTPDGERLDIVDFHLSSTTVSAGLQIGFDWLFCKCWHAVFTAEFVATGARKNNINDEADPIESGGIYNTVIGNTGTVFNFPLTVGLRYEF